jgi:hypothetical protein
MIKQSEVMTDSEHFQQLNLFDENLFSIESALKAKIHFLKARENLLSYSDVRWLDNVFKFYRDKRYITERQFSVIDSIITRLSVH